MKIIQEHLASPGQQALWQFHRLNPDSPAYNMVLARELHAELDPSVCKPPSPWWWPTTRRCIVATARTTVSCG